MKKLFFIFFSVFLIPVLQAQDRALGFEYHLPAGLRIENGGHVLDVTKPPFNAKGDGISDDTEAFVKAYTFLADTFKSGEIADKDPTRSFVIYIPDGTYLVSNTIIYSGSVIPGYCSNCEGLTQVRFMGESRENTIIRLKDNSPGFGEGAFKPVLSFGRTDFNNTAAENNVRNLTINTGSGNPGAIGLVMGGANNASGSNLLIKSEDGSGAIGLDFNIGTVIGWYHDIIVDGFDIGIRFPTDNFIHPIVEHVSLRNQKQYGMKFEGLGCATLRKVHSNNSVPAVYGNSIGVFPSVIDCEFTGGDPGASAIQLDQGQMFARNIKVEGYGSSISYMSASVVSGDIEEWVSSGPYKFDETVPERSMDLPIEEPPLYWNPDTTQWADVHEYGAVGDGITDDTQAVQAALNSGKPVVYFSRQRYRLTSPLHVPATVKLIEGFYTSLEGNSSTTFFIDEDSGFPLVVADMRVSNGIVYTHACDRTLVMDNTPTQVNLYENTSPVEGAKLFINNCNGLKSSGPVKNVRAWIRHVNTEAKNTQFLIDHSQVVVFGYKTEKNYTSFEARNGARLEVLGGQSNQQAWDSDLNNPAMLNNNSEVSLVFTTAQGWSQGYETTIKDIQGAIVKEIPKETFPSRYANSDVIRAVTLYNSYNTDPVSVTDIDIEEDSLRIVKGDSAIIDVNVVPFMATNPQITLTSLDENIAAVNSEYALSALNFGETKVVAVSLDGNFRDTLVVMVTDSIHPSGVEISEVEKSLVRGRFFYPDFQVEPSHSTNSDILWSSGNKDIARVSITGKITAVSAGQTYIYATTEDGGLKDSVRINVVTGDPFFELDGEVVFEAEHFHNRDPRLEEVLWKPAGDTPGSVGEYIEVEDGMGSSVSGTEHLVKTEVSYLLHFETPGEYQIYVRRYTSDGGSNSAYTAFNGENLSYFDNRGDYDNWIWKEFNRVMVPDSGDYLFEFIRREDGYKIDRVVLTMGNAPSGEGPAESIRLSEVKDVTGIELDITDLALEEGDTQQLTATISPPDALYDSIFWSSSDESVAIVDINGQVTAVSAGKAVISVETEQGGFTATCSVEVFEPLPGSFYLLSPTDNVEITGDTVEFSWESSQNAETYNFIVDDDQDFLNPEILLQDLTITSISFDMSDFDNMKYYWHVTAINAAGQMPAVDSGSFILNLSTGTTIPGERKMQIYPNPVKDELNVNIPGEHVFSVTITDLSGRIFMTKAFSKSRIQIPVTNLDSGLYMVNIQTEKATYTYKVMINR